MAVGHSGTFRTRRQARSRCLLKHVLSVADTQLIGEELGEKGVAAAVAALRAELEVAGAEAERLFARWQELEAVRAGSSTDR